MTIEPPYSIVSAGETVIFSSAGIPRTLNQSTTEYTWDVVHGTITVPVKPNNPIRLSGGIEVVYRLPHDIEGYLDEQWRHILKLAREGKLVN